MRVASVVIWKVLLVCIVASAGPLSNVWWGEEYTGPGMNQLDALLVVTFVSFVLAGLLFVVLAGTGYFLRRRGMVLQLSVDLILFGLAVGLAVAAGVTAKVVDA